MPEGSVLDRLSAEVMGEKVKAAKTLTPVAGEGRPVRVLPTTPATFPNDIPQEVIEQKVSELTTIIEHLIESRDALLRLVEKPLPGEVIDLDAERKAKEKAADEDFAARQTRLAEEAQASLSDVLRQDNLDGTTTKTVVDLAADDEGEYGWQCPFHDKAVEKRSEKTGRTYIGCPDCNSFKR